MMNRTRDKKQCWYCAAVFLTAVLMSACSRGPEGTASGTLSVVTTIFPLYDIARQVGGDAVRVRLLLPPGVEAHAYEPTPRDIVAINTADIVLYAGPDMDPWMLDILAGIDKRDSTIVDASRSVEGAHDSHAEHTENGDQADASEEQHGHDPHFWLDFSRAAETVDAVKEALIEKDPARRAEYEANAGEYKRKLAALDARYSEAIRRCRNHTIIYAGHSAFGYLARRYGLTILTPFTGFSPNAEARPRDIIRILEVMREQNIQYIFHEELIEPRAAKVLAEESGATLLLLHGAHNVTKQELADGVTFLSIMEDNLGRLKQGLGYQ